MSSDHGTHGLDALKARSLIETIWRRRTHRVSRGSDVAAGPMSYKSPQPRAPLSDARGGGADRRDRLHRPHHARPAVRRSAQRQADHGQAQPEHGRPHRRQPGQRPGHAFLPDQRQRHLLPAQAAAAPTASALDRRRCCSQRARKAKVQAARPPHRRARRQPRLSRPISTPTGSCRTCRARRSCSRSSTCRSSTSTG